jgi:hypothetical protein
MLISGVAGLLYARDAALGYGRGALGGAIAGGLCALIGIGVSVLLGDTPFSIWRWEPRFPLLRARRVAFGASSESF